VRRLVGLVLYVPAEGVEEGAEEVDSDLGLGISFGEIVMLVLFELPN
jgi:hypothetical protein